MFTYTAPVNLDLRSNATGCNIKENTMFMSLGEGNEILLEEARPVTIKYLIFAVPQDFEITYPIRIISKEFALPSVTNYSGSQNIMCISNHHDIAINDNEHIMIKDRSFIAAPGRHSNIEFSVLDYSDTPVPITHFYINLQIH